MRKRTVKQALQIDFSDIVKKAYDKGLCEREITVNKLIEEIKNDLKNLKIG